MPRLLPGLSIVLSLLMSTSASAMQPVCLQAPECQSEQAEQPETITHPSAEAYHQAMLEAIISANETLDWVVDEDANACGGYYQEPVNPNPEQHLTPDEADLRVSALAAMQTAEGYTEFSGDVEIYQGYRRLRCNAMRFSVDKQHSVMEGDIQLREPGVLLMAQIADINGASQQSFFAQTEYVLHNSQAHGKAEEVHITGAESPTLSFKDSSFTLCPPTREDWSFNASELEIDQAEGWGKLYHGVFKVRDVPVAYIPYIDFPVDDRRKSGFLWPSISGVGSSGVDLTLPYYFNLAPHYDLTYIPRYNSEHGFLHGIESRYKNPYSEWQIGGTYINNDKEVDGVKTKDDPQLDKKRWLAFVKESGRINPFWYASIDYQAVSDINYFRDWGTTGLDISKSLNIKRVANLYYTGPEWAFSASVVDYQSLEKDPLTDELVEEEYRRLPDIYWAKRNRFQNFQPAFLWQSQYTFFDHENRIRGQRVYIEPGLAIPMHWPALSITPELKVKHTHFNLNDSNDADETFETNTVYQGQHDTSVPTLSIDSRVYLEKDITWLSQEYTQTLTPRFYYYRADFEEQSHLPNFDTELLSFSYQQLFRESRFSSIDRIDDSHKFSWAIETALIDKTDGGQALHFGIGQTHYLRDRKVTPSLLQYSYQTLSGGETEEEIEQIDAYNQAIYKERFRNNSDIASELRWVVDEQSELLSTLIWDPYNNEASEASLAYHFKSDDNHIINASYRYRRNIPGIDEAGELFSADIEQTDFSIHWPLADQWQGFFRWHYDVTREETIEDISGVRYESCCWAVTVAYQRERDTFSEGTRIAESADVDYDYRWYLQFELKGFGGVTNSINRLLEESIQGYQSRENHP